MTSTTDPIEVQTDQIIEDVRRAVVAACDLRLAAAYQRGYTDALNGVRPPATAAPTFDQVEAAGVDGTLRFVGIEVER